ncbi:2-oxo acid dehydrogenase subunit E2 [Alicyclobacillus macrosporangiidus]|nr:2-oxo acid dehydrogenase subunit E2 [Alicyclobacillus macrosporangiidus]
MPLSLTIDHRVVDGGLVVRFLQAVARPLTEPEQLM